MAPKISPAPFADRRSALAATRGTVLAAHAAAGIACGVDREVSRLLRSCEGLARAAAARLEYLGRAQAAAGSTGGSVPEVKTDSNKEPTGKDKGKKRRSKRKKNKEGMKVDQASVVPASGAPAAVFMPPEFDDEWADSAVIHGPAPAPALPPAGLRDAVRDRPPRALVARRSGTRSPRRDGQQQPESCVAAVSPLVVGRVASIKHLDARPDLDGVYVDLVEFDAAAGRWVCVTRSKERLRIKADKLQGFALGFQALARQKFDAGDAL
jgi:hypothetical protein